MIFNSKSENDTNSLGIKMAKSLGEFRIICLFGEMGTGKTTFTKAFIKSLGVKSRIISPTYIFVRTYETSFRKIYHIDAYRLDEGDRFDEIKEILDDENAIIIIEWAEKIKSILPKKRLELHFESLNENEREIRIKKFF